MSAVDNWTTASELISSSEPLVVVLNKTFDFRGTEDTTTEQRCRSDCIRAYMAKNNGFKSQDVILQQVTYDNAPLKRMNVKSDKAIRGVGKSGVIFGKGLTLAGDNIIVQNIHITAQPTPFCWSWAADIPNQQIGAAASGAVHSWSGEAVGPDESDVDPVSDVENVLADTTSNFSVVGKLN
ncbi:hypothetical protein PF001_g14756 [Phytophthora fragariae]|uniref:Pectate lyase domain-containing protein n=1 Tax=Phytophthora fragariae TaxID=53985 RepID=A0A6A4D3G6_9STRA|nr:hypothetical protein PF003_g9392 [Phytophthora fragariae]KAE8943840.1 hypothetical protein PF009_g6426 [Phytophthora fragariae]KAE9131323.1 hypothetical protein PF006_g15551 [Phytophthora fragariae]KAE9211301.1 hypothetical protein PF004_g15960 [Phytophthora fragariae]KAE9300797.1 hypothetical protein PF001_g14756 [Phytophthora fragariae]